MTKGSEPLSSVSLFVRLPEKAAGVSLARVARLFVSDSSIKSRFYDNTAPDGELAATAMVKTLAKMLLFRNKPAAE
jgi:hypothetical protein